MQQSCQHSSLEKPIKILSINNNSKKPVYQAFLVLKYMYIFNYYKQKKDSEKFRYPLLFMK